MSDWPETSRDKLPISLIRDIKAMRDWWKRTFAFGSNRQPSRIFRETDIVRVRNDTGGDRRAGEVVGLGASILGTGEDYEPCSLWFQGETPADTHTVFGVLLEPCAWKAAEEDRPVVRVQVSGICLAFVYFTTIGDMGCVPQIGSHVLQGEPARVLYAVVTPPASTGEQLVPVLLSVMHCDALPAA